MSKTTTIGSELSGKGLLTVSCQRHRSSVISKHSLVKGTPQAIREWLISLAADSPARTSPLPEKAKVLPVKNHLSGLQWPMPYASFDPDTYSLKTAQCSLLADSSTSLVRFSKWGMMRRGVLYPLPTLARGISGKESGFLLPTPTVNGNYNRKGASKHSGDGLATAIKRLLHTSTVQDAKNNASGSHANPKHTGFLNPDWVEWFMGWPVGWSDVRTLNKLVWLPINMWPNIKPITYKKENRRNRVKAIGDGQVPQAAILAWNILSGPQTFADLIQCFTPGLTGGK